MTAKAKKRPRRSVHTEGRTVEKLTPEAAKAIEEVHDAAIEVLSRTRFAAKYVCESNLAGLLDYSRELAQRLDELLQIEKVIDSKYTPTKRVTTEYLLDGDD